MRNRTMTRWACGLVAGAMLAATVGPAAAFDSALPRSLLFPGAGQAHNGRYTKAAIFASAAIASGVGLFFSQVHYGQAVERFDNAKRDYLAFPEQLEAGKTVSFSEIETTYSDMQRAHDDAERRVKWRNVFLGVLITTYTINLIDIIVSEPRTGEETAPPVSMELTPDGGMRLVGSIRF